MSAQVETTAMSRFLRVLVGGLLGTVFGAGLPLLLALVVGWMNSTEYGVKVFVAVTPCVALGAAIGGAFGGGGWYSPGGVDGGRRMPAEFNSGAAGIARVIGRITGCLWAPAVFAASWKALNAWTIGAFLLFAMVFGWGCGFVAAECGKLVDKVLLRWDRG